jgi:hypothetical protein
MRLIVLACLLAAATLVPEPAAAFVELSGELVATDACEAYRGFRRRANPDGARLVPGERYRVEGGNREDGAWLQVVLPGAEPARRWVEARCGTLLTPGAAASGLMPFFDEIDSGADDPAPPPPPLDAFDRAVLEVCGPWGSRPRRGAFRAMLDRPELAAELRRLRDTLDGDRLAPDRFKDQLADTWFDAGGFAHLFCGEPRPNELAGLHYRGRYLELQRLGLAGRADAADCRVGEVEPPVYTMGVRYRLPGGGPPHLACPKGYAHDLGAADLLLVATRAARAARGAVMCLVELRPSVGAPYFAVVVSRDGAVRTFYPDASPRCDDGAQPAACAC